jgi:hypothetical protein
MPANNKSCALFRASNICAMDYPFDAALTSVLRFCDEAVIVEGPSYDDTHDALVALQHKHGPNRVKLIQREWKFDRQWQERVWNWGAEQTDADWLMYADADEAIMEYDARLIYAVMQKPNIGLINLQWFHLYGTPNWQECQQFGTHQTRIGRRSLGFGMVNLCTDETPRHAACAVMADIDQHRVNAHTWRGPETAVLNARLMHYGWVREGRAMAVSQAKHRAWYADGAGLEDGRIPDLPPFDFQMQAMLEKGRIRRYTGFHPPELREWFAAHETEWASRESALEWRLL